MQLSEDSCPLCRSHDTNTFQSDGKRVYKICRHCELVFVPPAYFLSREAEKAHYDLHNNDPADLRYRKFLSRLANPLIAQLATGSRGLDFGCGPGPTLSLMLSEAGFPTAIYDPIYAPNSDVWKIKYDFITASEVVEHLHDPRSELERLWSCLNRDGFLGIMTKRRFENCAFAAWHYINDPTHVIFFSDATFQWLGDHWSAELEFASPDVVLFRKRKT